MKYFLYILYSKNYDRYYVGISNNPQRRLHFHNTVEKGFTSRYRPWEIVYAKEFSDKKSAMHAEKKIKNWKSKKLIRQLVLGEISIS